MGARGFKASAASASALRLMIFFAQLGLLFQVIIAMRIQQAGGAARHKPPRCKPRGRQLGGRHLAGQTTKVQVPGGDSSLCDTLKVGKPVMFALEPGAMHLRAVSLCNIWQQIKSDCARSMEVLTGPSQKGPWTSVLQFTSRQTKDQQTFLAVDDAPVLSGFIKVVVHDTYGGGAQVYSMELEGEAFG